jgi:hypothetical protein
MPIHAFRKRLHKTPAAHSTLQHRIAACRAVNHHNHDGVLIPSQGVVESHNATFSKAITLLLAAPLHNQSKPRASKVDRMGDIAAAV